MKHPIALVCLLVTVLNSCDKKEKSDACLAALIQSNNTLESQYAQMQSSIEQPMDRGYRRFDNTSTNATILSDLSQEVDSAIMILHQDTLQKVGKFTYDFERWMLRKHIEGSSKLPVIRCCTDKMIEGEDDLTQVAAIHFLLQFRLALAKQLTTSERPYLRYVKRASVFKINATDYFVPILHTPGLPIEEQLIVQSVRKQNDYKSYPNYTFEVNKTCDGLILHFATQDKNISGTYIIEIMENNYQSYFGCTSSNTFQNIYCEIQ